MINDQRFEEINESNKQEKKKRKKKPFKQRFIHSLKNSALHLLTFIISLLIFVIIIATVICASTSVVKTSNISTTVKDLNGIKIVQLSDFNNKTVKNLSEKINEINPNFVAITGDLVDEYKTTELDEDKLLKQFDDIKAPIYFVPGDMEHKYKNYEKLKEKMKEKGIIVLENSSEKITVKGKEILITGILDPSFYYEDLETFNTKLKELKSDNSQILLSHRAELMNLYAENNYECVLSGHTHGGYIQIPFFGAIFASNQGVRPQYVNGVYTKANTTMIVSRGIGVGQFPFRLFNFGEILSIHLN